MDEGAVIGQYRILGVLGKGGMGAVYAAQHTLVGKRAAIKVLLPELSARREIVERFFNEARAMAAMQDPGIVQMFDFGYATDGSAYIVMELLAGETLDKRLERQRVLPLGEALRITRQAASTLAVAHASGIIHRDIKPGNIYIAPDSEAAGGERAKILDFGIAKLSGISANQVETETGAFMGTPLYMSPEQCRGAGEIDLRSDVYSLGCVLFHIATGRTPFQRVGLGDLITAHMQEAPPVPSTIVRGLPRAFDDLVRRCLAKQPAERFQSMTELRVACEQLLAQLAPGHASVPRPGAPIAAPSEAPIVAPMAATVGTAIPRGVPTTLSSAASQRMANPPRRRVALWAGVAVAVVGGIVALVVATAGNDDATSAATAPRPRPAPAPVVTPAPAPAPSPSPSAPATVPAAAPIDASVTAPHPPPPAKRKPPVTKGGGSGSAITVPVDPDAPM